MKKLILLSILFSLNFLCFSQDNILRKQKSLLNKATSMSKEGDLKDILIKAKDGLLEDQINLLIKEILDINKDFEKKFSISVESLIKQNKDYLDQLENEYKSKLKEEHQKISDLKKSVDDILKIKDLELKIVDKKINDINKNLKKLSSDDFIKTFKKDLKKQLDEFKNSTINSFEEQLNIKLDTINNEK